MTRWRAILLGFLLSVATASLALETGCAAPTLPIPPPTALSSAPDAGGLVTVSGSANPSAYVFVLNENTQVGVIVHAQAAGTYSVQIPASIDDMITVWQMIGEQASQQDHLVVPH